MVRSGSRLEAAPTALLPGADARGAPIVTWIAIAVVALLGAAHIVTDARGPRWLAYVFKPATVLAIIAIAVLADPAVDEHYRRWIVIGLGFSLVGDVFLMLRGNHFLAGLLSFLVAHLCYIVAFQAGVTLPGPAWLMVALLAAAAGLHVWLLGHFGNMRIPGTVYMAVILAMVWLAGLRYLQQVEPRAGLAAAGAVLFAVSDTSLSVNRFVKRFPRGQWLTLGTYYTAQCLIALSVGVPVLLR